MRVKIHGGMRGARRRYCPDHDLSESVRVVGGQRDLTVVVGRQEPQLYMGALGRMP